MQKKVRHIGVQSEGRQSAWEKNHEIQNELNSNKARYNIDNDCDDRKRRSRKW